MRLEGDHVGNTLIEVEGNTMGLGVGNLVTLKKPTFLDGDFNPFWDDGDFKKEYLIVSATYSISVDQYETGDVAGSDEPFRATYSLLDSQSAVSAAAKRHQAEDRRAANRPCRRDRRAKRSTPTSSDG